MDGAIATWDAGRLYIDGELVKPGGLPRAAKHKGSSVYWVGRAPWKDFAATYLREGDTMAGPSIGEPKSADVRCGAGGATWRLMGGDVWGLPQDAVKAAERLQELREAVGEEGWRWGPTSGALASRVGLQELRGTLRQTRTRWRSLAMAAMHPGPQVALTGGAPSAVQLDRRAAYLSPLWDPVPVPGSWRSWPWGTSWGSVREAEGFVQARVFVPDLGWDLPPLPKRTRHGVIYPTGELIDAWPIAWLRWAEERAQVVVRQVLDVQTCDTARLCEPLAERFDRVSYTPLRKQLYQRWWGRLGSLGWFKGEVTKDRDGGGVHVLAMGDKWVRWRWDGRDPISHRQPPDYRPDWAAWVAAHNATRVHKLTSTLERGSLHLVHVDAVWTSDPHAETKASRLHPQGWAPKSRGELEVYGVGCYKHGAKLKAMGYPAWEELTPSKARTWASYAMAWNGSEARVWSGPPGAPGSTSSAPQVSNLRMLEDRIVYPTWHRPLWTPHGWAVEEEAPEAVADVPSSFHAVDPYWLPSESEAG